MDERARLAKSNADSDQVHAHPRDRDLSARQDVEDLRGFARFDGAMVTALFRVVMASKHASKRTHTSIATCVRLVAFLLIAVRGKSISVCLWHLPRPPVPLAC